MYHFGDISGNFGSLLSGDCDIVSQAIVSSGERSACRRCPKRALDRVGNKKEAKWNDLPPVEKQRVADCFRENADELDFHYASINWSDFNRMYANHLLFEGDGINTARIAEVIGIGYVTLFVEQAIAEPSKKTLSTFVYDKVYHDKQSDRVRTAMERHTPSDLGFHSIEWGNSSQYHGIQAADCLAGMVAATELEKTDWGAALSAMGANDLSGVVHAQIENWLTDVASR